MRFAIVIASGWQPLRAGSLSAVTKAGVDYVVTIPVADVWHDAFSFLPLPLVLAAGDTMQILRFNQAAAAYLAIDTAVPLVLSDLFNSRTEAYADWLVRLLQPQIPPLDLLLSRPQPLTVRVYTARLKQADRLYLLLSLIDISDKCDQIRRLEQLAAHDDLTGLLNRRFFREQLDAALFQAKADGQACYLAYMDLDGLKAVNDAYGHSEGDRYITTVTSLIRRLLRPGDIAGRVGGDEFAVLFRQCPRIHAEQTVWRLQRLVTEAPQAQTLLQPFSMGVSVGLVVIESWREIATDNLLGIADAVMYKQKQQHGRPKVHIISDSDTGSRR